MDETPLTFDLPSDWTIDYTGKKDCKIKTNGAEKKRCSVRRRHRRWRKASSQHDLRGKRKLGPIVMPPGCNFPVWVQQATCCKIPLNMIFHGKRKLGPSVMPPGCNFPVWVQQAICCFDSQDEVRSNISAVEAEELSEFRIAELENVNNVPDCSRQTLRPHSDEDVSCEAQIIKLKGSTFEKRYQDALTEIQKEAARTVAVRLEFERDNPKDINAIKIDAQVDGAWKIIGYVPVEKNTKSHECHKPARDHGVERAQSKLNMNDKSDMEEDDRILGNSDEYYICLDTLMENSLPPEPEDTPEAEAYGREEFDVLKDLRQAGVIPIKSQRDSVAFGVRQAEEYTRQEVPKTSQQEGGRKELTDSSDSEEEENNRKKRKRTGQETTAGTKKVKEGKKNNGRRRAGGGETREKVLRPIEEDIPNYQSKEPLKPMGQELSDSEEEDTNDNNRKKRKRPAQENTAGTKKNRQVEGEAEAAMAAEAVAKRAPAEARAAETVGQEPLEPVGQELSDSSQSEEEDNTRKRKRTGQETTAGTKKYRDRTDATMQNIWGILEQLDDDMSDESEEDDDDDDGGRNDGGRNDKKKDDNDEGNTIRRLLLLHGLKTFALTTTTFPEVWFSSNLGPPVSRPIQEDELSDSEEEENNKKKRKRPAQENTAGTKKVKPAYTPEAEAYGREEFDVLKDLRQAGVIPIKSQRDSVAFGVRQAEEYTRQEVPKTSQQEGGRKELSDSKEEDTNDNNRKKRKRPAQETTVGTKKELTESSSDSELERTRTRKRAQETKSAGTKRYRDRMDATMQNIFGILEQLGDDMSDESEDDDDDGGRNDGGGNDKKKDDDDDDGDDNDADDEDGEVEESKTEEDNNSLMREEDKDEPEEENRLAMDSNSSLELSDSEEEDTNDNNRKKRKRPAQENTAGRKKVKECKKHGGIRSLWAGDCAQERPFHRAKERPGCHPTQECDRTKERPQKSAKEKQRAVAILGGRERPQEIRPRNPRRTT
ncbi:Hypp5445 [Branchiostoma lanceolatum]|uniref:Hypp5445 protein n=1 Tax=Branchiostoma lanceolatum TaxID=7740 RepID=A0A8J9VPM2_BRALA|nr:Hypp5445 [Branchiostoma lanceolatum]